MKKLILIFLITAIPFCAATSGVGFAGAGGFSFYLWKPDLGPINDELRGLGMPELHDVAFLYGGQGFAHVSDRFRIGGMGFGGSTHVKDFKDGYAREASFHISWGGFLMEYILYEPGYFEFYGGGTIGWGSVSINLQKSSGPVNWDEIWNSYEPIASDTENISSKLEHSFFMLQPRLGVRYYLLDWLAISGSVDVPLVNLSSGGWSLNGDDVYDAPSLNLIQPFFQFSILAGG
ncbi:MAG TPA: hypothetical protein ENF16_01325 [Bacteroidetes bacterium]|nr:hypothetical protein [Bacteroidota bacterium]